MVSHAEQFLSSESDEVRYRATLLIEVLSVTNAFDNQVVEIQKQDSVKEEIESMNNARKEMTSLNEKCESPVPTEADTEINLAAAIESGVTDTPKEESASETPKEDTPKEEAVETHEDHNSIRQLSDLLERLTEELAPVSAKAQRKVKLPQGLDLETPLASLEPEKPIERFGTVTFVDGPLFSYEEKEEGGRVGMGRWSDL